MKGGALDASTYAGATPASIYPESTASTFSAPAGATAPLAAVAESPQEGGSQALASVSARGAHLKVARRYGIASLVCLAFSLIYAQFSHEVFSPFMTWAFLIPLLAGCAPALVMAAFKAPAVAVQARAPWALAVATFTVASILRGIFEIAGTSSPLLIAYVGAGAALAVFALVRAMATRRH